MHLAVISSVGRLCWLIWREPVWYWCDMTSCQELKCECWPDEESEDHQSCHVSSWWEREHLNRSCRFSIRVMDDTPTQPSFKTPRHTLEERQRISREKSSSGHMNLWTNGQTSCRSTLQRWRPLHSGPTCWHFKENERRLAPDSC